jgi:hypothetical protein
MLLRFIIIIIINYNNIIIDEEKKGKKSIVQGQVWRCYLTLIVDIFNSVYPTWNAIGKNERGRERWGNVWSKN